MSFEPQFLDMMPHIIAHQRFVSRDFNNIPTYDVAGEQRYRCRITGKVLALRRHEREEDTVIFDVYVCPYPLDENDKIQWDEPEIVVGVEDKIILPDDQAWIDRTPLLFAVGRLTDEDGHHHVKLQCGWMYHRQGQ